MARNETTSAVIDGLLRFMALGGILATTLLAPNALQALDKPLKKYFDKLDERAQNREYRRVMGYMKGQGLVRYPTQKYEHGITLTELGKKRARKAKLEYVKVKRPKKWDGKWRIIFFDVPQPSKYGRDQFSRKLKELGLVQLQKSVWIHPFPCRTEIGLVSSKYNVDSFVTYIQTDHIDNQRILKGKFNFKF